MELTLEEIKQEELKILLEIDNICRSINVKYTLVAGTLLGAIRHKGFIPWDDDIDIGMLEEDYNKFVKYCNNNDIPFKLLNHDTNKNYPYLYSKAYSEKTILNEEWRNLELYDLGVFVDIFPIVPFGDSLDEVAKNYKKIKFQKYLLISSIWNKNALKHNRSFSRKIAKIIFFVLSRFINIDKSYNKIMKKINKLDDKKMCIFIGGENCERNVFDINMFKDFIELDFENYKFTSIADYDKYLKLIYGDYMKLPPKEKQVSNHDFIAMWKK